MSQVGRFVPVEGSAITTLTGNAGGPVGPDGAGNINVTGLNVITTVGNPGFHTLNIELDNGLNGQVLIGGGVNPVWATIDSLSGTIDFTAGANSLSIDVAAQVAIAYNTDVGAAVPAANVLNVVGGFGIQTSGVGNTITITNTGLANNWVVVAGAAQAMAVNTNYIANNGGGVVFTLPAIAAVGTMNTITCINVGGWTIHQNAGQSINFVAVSTTVGVGGSLSSTQEFDSVQIVCVIANTMWNVLYAAGNLAVV